MSKNTPNGLERSAAVAPGALTPTHRAELAILALAQGDEPGFRRLIDTCGDLEEYRREARFLLKFGLVLAFPFGARALRFLLALGGDRGSAGIGEQPKACVHLPAVARSMDRWGPT
jgi:hypothetical protein